MSYFIIKSYINGYSKVQSFYIESELMDALEVMDDVADYLLGEDYIPFEDGSIGFYTTGNDSVFLEERIT